MHPASAARSRACSAADDGAEIGSLAQGASGICWNTLQHLIDCLRQDLLPIVPSQGSCGASGDLAPLAHMTAALMGVGEMSVRGERLPAATALTRAGMKPLVLGPKEGLALLNGTQTSTALALAALFEAERVFHAALVTGAMSTDAAKGSDGPFDSRIQMLRGHRGQIDVAAALRTLMAGSAIRASHRRNDDRLQDPYCLRCQPQVMGACLDLLRHTAVTLEIEANGVSDNPLVFAATNEVISAETFTRSRLHLPPMRLPSRCAKSARSPSAVSRCWSILRCRGFPAVPDSQAGVELRLHDCAGYRCRSGLRKQATRLSSERRFDSHVSQPGGPRVDGGSWCARLLAMVENATNVIAIELLAGAQGPGIPCATWIQSAAGARFARCCVERVPKLEDDRHFSPDPSPPPILSAAACSPHRPISITCRRLTWISRVRYDFSGRQAE
jgi:histidine ammonia-lyase